MTFDKMPDVMYALFQMLPPPGKEWPVAERLLWLRAFEAVCRLVFKDDVALQITNAGEEKG